MKKIIVFIALLCFGASLVNAQEVYNSSGKPGYHKKTRKKKGYDPDKLILGGGLNAGFGGGYINVGVAPIVGYRITNQFSAGIGLGYQYNRTPEFVDPVDPMKVSYIHANIIYPSIWTRYFVFKNIFADAVFEHDFISLKAPGYNVFTGELETQKYHDDVSCVLLGIGLRQPLGGRVSFFGEIMYDVLQQANSPYYGQPVFRLGIAAGF